MRARLFSEPCSSRDVVTAGEMALRAMPISQASGRYSDRPNPPRGPWHVYNRRVTVSQPEWMYDQRDIRRYHYLRDHGTRDGNREC